MAIARSALADVQKSYNTAHHKPPSWTMRKKTSFGDQDKFLNTGGITAGPLDKELEAVKNMPPKWSMRARDAGIPPPKQTPGPGDYAIPTTMAITHPLMSVTPRGWGMGIPRSASAGSVMRQQTPGPLNYNVRAGDRIGNITHEQRPRYSMRERYSGTSDKETRPGCQKYKIEKVTERGPVSSPQWSFLARGASSGNALELSPGPGQHKPMIEHASRIKRPPSWSWGSQPRFPEVKKDTRPY